MFGCALTGANGRSHVSLSQFSTKKSIFCNKKCWKYEKKIVLLQSALTTPDTIYEVLLTILLSTN